MKLLIGVCEGFDVDFQQFSIAVNVFRADNLMNTFVFYQKTQCSAQSEHNDVRRFFGIVVDYSVK